MEAVSGGTYTRTGTPDRIAFCWNGTGHSNLNFGDVHNIAFATDGAKTGLPGSTVTYAHTFTAGTAARVSFSVVSETATPAITGAEPGPVEQSHAVRRRGIIRCFGRFPHRRLLLRATTAQEESLLDEGGFAG
ncbi:hypothetical protein J2W24_004743 [Variovorax boronicumulans]|nr:hypothetical protein [Variovorax boronicumulans]